MDGGGAGLSAPVALFPRSSGPEEDISTPGHFLMRASPSLPSSRPRLSPAIGAALLCLAVAAAIRPAPALAQAADAPASMRDYAIPAGALSGALNRFAAETGLALSFEPAQVGGLRSPGLHGRYSVAGGFAALLAGSGLSARAEGGGWIVERQAPAVIATGPLRVDGGRLAHDAGDLPYRTAAPVGTIDAEDLHTRYGGDPQTALRSAPGVFTRQQSHQPGIEVNVRGLSGYGRVNAMIDGVPQTFRNIAGHEASGGSLLYVHPELLGGIDVTRGTVAGAHGAGTLAGAANFRTLGIDDVLDGDAGRGVFARVKFGDNGAHKAGALVYGQRNEGLWGGQGRVELVAGVAYTGTGAYRAGDDTEVPGGLSGYASDNAPKSLLAKLDVVASDAHRLDLGVRTYENRFINSSYDWQIDNRTWTAGYAYTPDSDWIDLDIDLHYNDTELNYLDTGGSYRGRRTEDVGYGVAATNRALVPLGGADLRLGYGLSWARNDFRTHAMRGGNHPGELDKASAYSDATLDFGRYRLHGGLRYDRYRIHGWRAPYAAGTGDCPAGGPPCGDSWASRSGGRLLPRIGASFDATEALELYATWSMTYRPPTTHEAFFALIPFGNGTGTGVVNNLDLKPETSRSWDVGANYLRESLWREGDRLRLKVGGFLSDIDDFVVNDFVDVPGRGSSAMWVNRPGTTRMHGVEIEGGYDAGAFYADLAFSDTHTADQPLGQGAGMGNGEGSILPDRVATLDLGVRLFGRRLTLGAQGRYVGEGKEARYDWAAWENYWATTDAYALLDLYGSLELGRGSQLFFSVENAQDRRYGYAGSGYSGYSNQYGRGRTFVVGYSGRLGLP